jgi:phage repressor protein C with HTH and peptisase S24 domain
MCPVLHSERPPTGVAVVDLPFLPASARPHFIQTPHELRNEALASVRFQLYEPEDYYPDQLLLEVDSDEMAPRLCKGDWLRCHRVPADSWAYLPDGIYAVVFSNSLMIRRVRTNTLQQTGVFTAYSDNPAHKKPVRVPHDQLRQIWRVLEIVSGSIR